MHSKSVEISPGIKSKKVIEIFTDEGVCKIESIMKYFHIRMKSLSTVFVFIIIISK